MWQFHFKSLEMLRPSILALVPKSIGMPLTTTGSTEVGFLVLKIISSSLHFVSFSWNLSTVARLARVSNECDCLGSYLSSPKLWYHQHTSRDWCQEHRVRWSWWWTTTFLVWYLEESPPVPRPIPTWPGLTRCLREVKKSVIHEMTASGLLYLPSFLTKLLWSIRSRAFMK